MPGNLTLSAALLVVLMACTPAPTVPIASVDCGPQPSLEEAKRRVRVVAERTLWGPNTEIKDVTVGAKTRWYRHLTDQWPRSRPAGATLEGWLITFQAKPTNTLNPYLPFRTVEALVDRDGAVHWRTGEAWGRQQDRWPGHPPSQPTAPPPPPAPMPLPSRL